MNATAAMAPGFGDKGDRGLRQAQGKCVEASAGLFDMLIQKMSRQASIDLLARTRFGRLACAHDGQPYIIPLSFAYGENYLYAFSTLGQKITWMRANPRVCIEAEELVTRQNWATVIVVGQYEELTDAPECKVLQNYAYNLLQRNPLWWEPGYVKTVLDGTERPLNESMYFRIHIDQISGHRGVPEEAASERPSMMTRFTDCLQKILRRPEHH